MQNLSLTWDLFVLVFFIIIVAYSFIIGRDNTIKVILGTYVAAIAADAGGNLFGQYFAGSAFFLKILKFASLGTEAGAIIFCKVLLFVLLVILFAVKGAFEVRTIADKSSAIRLVTLVLYALMSAGLIISCILLFVSGISLVGGVNDESAKFALTNIAAKSKMIHMILNNAYLLFCIPAISFIIHSLYSREEG